MQTKVERLCDLFADRSELVGWRSANKVKYSRGQKRLAEAIGVDHSLISRWNSTGTRGGHGSIPPKYNARIIEAVDAAGIHRGLLHGILDDQKCPACGQPLAPGHFVEVRR